MRDRIPREQARLSVLRALTTIGRQLPFRNQLITSSMVSGLVEWLTPRKATLCPYHGYKIWIDPNDKGPSRAIAVHGEWERHQKEAIAPFLSPGQTIIDVGANIGDFSIWALSQIGSSGTIYAFEPNRLAYSLLNNTIVTNDITNVRAIEAALAEETGYFDLFEDSETSDCSSLISEAVTHKSQTRKVKVLRLDDFVEEHHIDKLNLMKVDIQGAEYHFLRGAESTIRKHRPVCVIEFSPFHLMAAGTEPAVMFDLIREYWRNIVLLPLYRDHGSPRPISRFDEIHEYVEYAGKSNGGMGYCDLIAH